MWAISAEHCEQFISAMRANEKITAEDKREFDAVITEQNSADTPYIYQQAGSSAAINITGVLTDKPNFWAWLVGGGNTTYADIIESAKIADSNDDVDHVTINVASGGGQASPMWLNAMRAVANISKPTTVNVTLAASAAYGLASQGDEIIAQNKMAMVGSIGVVATLGKNDYSIEITSSNAKFKRPDPETEEGKAVIREEIDQIESIFIEQISAGRGVSEKDVIANYGQGKVFTAEKALQLGMIDSVSDSASNSSKSGNAANSQPKGEETMCNTVQELKAKYPSLCAALEQGGVDAGIAKERERVEAHLDLGASSGANEKAIEFIRGGNDVGTKENAAYTTAFFSNQTNANRTNDNPGDLNAGGQQPKGEADTADKQAADQLAKAWSLNNG